MLEKFFFKYSNIQMLENNPHKNAIVLKVNALKGLTTFNKHHSCIQVPSFTKSAYV